MTKRSCLSAALEFLDRGWVPFPVAPKAKEPLMAWGHLRDNPPTVDDLRAWWRTWPDANVAIVTGKPSNLAVIDVDGPEGWESLTTLGLPSLGPVSESARGPHFYCATQNLVVPSAVGIAPGIDVRGEGGYVVAPPSLHPVGRRYRWRHNLQRTLPPVPEWAIRPSHLDPAVDRTPGWVARTLRGVAQGARNQACARLAGYFFSKGCGREVVEAMMLAVNRLNRPVLPDHDVIRTVRSVARKATLQRYETLPGLEGTILEIRIGLWGGRLSPGLVGHYEAICVAEWVRGSPPGSEMFLSARELEAHGGVAVRHSRRCLQQLADCGLIEFTPAGRAAGRRGMAARVRRIVPIPTVAESSDMFSTFKTKTKEQGNYKT